MFLQNVIGVSFAGLFGIDRLLGVMAGAVSMNGGHGGAAAYGQTIEDLGISSALAVGMAAATLGLICGSISGGPVARYLIKKNDLKPASGKIEEYVEKDERPIKEESFMVQVGLLTFSMAAGTYLGDLFTNVTGFVLPSYIRAMFVAVIVRNLADRFIKGTVNMREINLIGDISLAIFSLDGTDEHQAVGSRRSRTTTHRHYTHPSYRPRLVCHLCNVPIAWQGLRCGCYDLRILGPRVGCNTECNGKHGSDREQVWSFTDGVPGRANCRCIPDRCCI